MGQRSPSLCMAALLAALATPLGAQVPTFASRSELVVLSATAVDGHGRPVTNLKREELRVFEEGRPQAIVHFALGADVPARVLILVDASGSMNGQLKTTSARMAGSSVTRSLGATNQSCSGPVRIASTSPPRAASPIRAGTATPHVAPTTSSSLVMLPRKPATKKKIRQSLFIYGL